MKPRQVTEAEDDGPTNTWIRMIHDFWPRDDRKDRIEIGTV